MSSDATSLRRVSVPAQSEPLHRVAPDALKACLGAATHFQAGLQAALRGWITDAGVPEGSGSASAGERQVS